MTKQLELDLGCIHPKVIPPAFDEKAARRFTREEVQKRWPRLCATCPDCGEAVVLYASYAHYLYGDW